MTNAIGDTDWEVGPAKSSNHRKDEIGQKMGMFAARPVSGRIVQRHLEQYALSEWLFF